MKSFPNDNSGVVSLGLLKLQQDDDAVLDTEQPDRPISCQAMGHISASEGNEWVHPPLAPQFLLSVSDALCIMAVPRYRTSPKCLYY